jgi:hypothetical protein
LSSVWTAELTVVSATATPGSSAGAGGGAVGTAAGYCLMAADKHGNLFALTGAAAIASFGAGPTYEWQASFGARYKLTTGGGLNDGADPFTWHTYDGSFGTNGAVATGLTQANGSNGAAYFSGGTLAIVKDFGGGTLTYVTPLGNIVRSLAEMNGGAANNDDPLFPVGHGHQIDATDPTPVGGGQETSLLKDFWCLKDGARVYGHSLLPGDRGTWNFWQYDPGSVATDGSGDALNGYLQSLDFSQAQIVSTFVFGLGYSAAQNDWRTPFEFPNVNRGTDMDQAREHGVLWRAGPDITNEQVLNVERTFDGGRSWQRFQAYFDPTSSNSSPSINWFAQKLYLTWHDGSHIRTSVSVDGGQNWTVPGTFPYTGTNPRHIIDKEGGVGLYFFFVSNDLKVARSFDGGNSFVDGAPLLVVAGVGAQQIDADFAPDGSVVLSLFVGVTWTKYRSRDFGASWL